jgi:hypothetical protein
MSSQKPGIYVIIEFDWPKNYTHEMTKNARTLHDVTQNKEWIKEIVAASGGVGGGPTSIWIFWLKNYAALDLLLGNEDNEVNNAYKSFFKDMVNMTEKVRGEVLFIDSKE